MHMNSGRFSAFPDIDLQLELNSLGLVRLPEFTGSTVQQPD